MKKLQLGSCVYRVDNSRRKHAYFVITEPYGDPPRVLAVNITDAENYYDQTVVLEDGHPAIKKKSVVAYRKTVDWIVSDIEDELHNNEERTDLHHKEPVCSEELTETLRRGLLKSKGTPEKFKQVLRNELLGLRKG